MKDISLPFDRARVKYTTGPTQPLEMKDNGNMILDPEEIASAALRRDTEFKICRASDQLHKRMDLIREALTSPSAFRDYDYERLEFYGDSIAGFLVILELFLSNPTFVEGDLDHERINRV
jgi:dsRNA-specific ribonuclease